MSKWATTSRSARIRASIAPKPVRPGSVTGRRSTISAGSTIVGDGVRVGGAAVFRGHVTVGSNVTIGGHSEIWRDVPDNAFVSGRPAKPHREELRLQVLIRKLPKLFARVDALEGNKKPPSDA